MTSCVGGLVGLGQLGERAGFYGSTVLRDKLKLKLKLWFKPCWTLALTLTLILSFVVVVVAFVVCLGHSEVAF